ncbi:MAG: hypothetical protein Q7Q73_09485 [Verrucomicrobiota bacterium JB024]|nr:hypothetical protein [Verrucomicrobiota bacterium JB024]
MLTRASSPSLPFATRPPGTDAHGFALIIAMVLMGLVLLLMVSLSTMVRVELESFSTTHTETEARANALLAAQVAIGRVQKLLGPDQRVTADAGIQLNVLPEKKHWVGVWNSDGTGNPAWLVSGEESPDEDFGPRTVEIVSDGTAVDTVRVPLEDVEEDGVLSGYIGYWVADLSQRARVDLVDEELVNAAAQVSWPSPMVSAPAYGVSVLDGMDGLRTSTESTLEGNTIRDTLGRLGSPSDLTVINSDLSQPVRQYFHGLATGTRGLLTDVVDGGMKVDLSSGLQAGAAVPAGGMYDDGPSWDLLRDYVSLKNEVSQDAMDPQNRVFKMVGGADAGNYPSAHGVMPIVMFWEITAQIVMEGPPAPKTEYDSGDHVPMYFELSPTVVLGNPYDVRLKEGTYIFRIMSGGGSYDPPGTVNRHPAFNYVLFRASDDKRERYVSEEYGNYINEFLPDFPGHGGAKDTFEWQENGFRVKITTAFEPGEIKVFSLTGNTQLPGSSDDYELELEAAEPQGYYARSADISSKMQGGTGVTAEEWNDINNGVLYPRIILRTGLTNALLYLGEVDENATFKSVNLASNQQVKFPYTSGDKVVFGATLKGPVEDTNSPKDPVSEEGAQTLAHYDIRSNYQSTLYSGGSGNKDFATSPAYTPIADVVDKYNLFNIWDTGMVDPTTGEPRLILFHVLRSDPVSLAELQHADLGRNVYSPTYAIGNSLASPWIAANQLHGPADPGPDDMSYLLNQTLWDKYYFSSIPAETLAPAVPLNQRLQIVPQKGVQPSPADLRDPTTAATWLYVRGPFNVNSISVAAWRALLSGLRGYQLPYTDALTGDAGIATVGGGAYSRFSTPVGAPVPGVGVDDEEADDTTAEYWRGFRTLSDEQIENLAGQIVNQVRERGPFRSLADFVNRDPDAEGVEQQLSGAIQSALDAEDDVEVDGTVYTASGINPQPTGDNAVGTLSAVEYLFPDAVSGLRSRMAPGYLSQADVLSEIGSVLTVRGDTFLIRGYGESVDPMSGQTRATARCEIVIQRTAEYLEDPDQNPAEPANEANALFGRAFQVVSFRWLTDTDY